LPALFVLSVRAFARMPGSFRKYFMRVKTGFLELLLTILLLLSLPVNVVAAEKLVGKKILHVASYHAGYPWTDSIEKAMRDVALSKGIEYRVFYMDTKNRSGESDKLAAARRASAFIQDFKPDVVITSDDDAAKYVLMAYYKDAALPFVFNGVNWDASVYGLPYRNTTGMVEVDLTHRLVEQLQNYAKGKRVGLISMDDISERKNVEGLQDVLKLKLDQIYLVKTFEEWQKSFIRLQGEVDSVIFLNYVGILNWEEAAAIRFIEKNVKVPVGVSQPWMMPYAMIGITKLGEEHGEWSISTALRILGGARPSDIPVERNKKGKLYVNIKMADRIGLTFSSATLRNAEIVR
jgi:ABC-type uncharacterized transport system substrate-binding protein